MRTSLALRQVMLAQSANTPRVDGSLDAYRPRDPTQSLLYRVIQEHWLTFLRAREEEGRYLPAYVKREFDSFMGCGVLANGFMRLKCDSCSHEKLVAFSCKRRGFCSSCGARRMSESAAFLTDWVLPNAPIRQWVVSFPIQLRYWMARDSKLMGNVLGIVIRTIASVQRKKAKRHGFKAGESGSVTLVQRFGGSANLNIHFHTMMIEGVYRDEGGKATFHPLQAPSNEEVKEVLSHIQARVVRHLKRQGYLTDGEGGESVPNETNNANDEMPLDLFQGASVQSRIAVGERAGERVRKLGSFGIEGDPALQQGTRCASLGGFSLHANTAVEAGEKDRLEKLCRYVARPPIAEMRLYECSDGGIGYCFKKQWSDGTQAVYFTPLELIEKLVALIPQPRIHLTRFHGVLAPNHRLRSQIVPEQPVVVPLTIGEDRVPNKPRDPRRLSWSELLKRVFQVDLTTCPDCGGTLRFIAAIMERTTVAQILSHLNISAVPPKLHPPRAPPQKTMFDEFSS